MTISEIYAKHERGSLGFCIEVETHCGYNASRSEIERIANAATSSDDFQRIWEDDDWWADENQ